MRVFLIVDHDAKKILEGFSVETLLEARIKLEAYRRRTGNDGWVKLAEVYTEKTIEEIIEDYGGEWKK